MVWADRKRGREMGGDRIWRTALCWIPEAGLRQQEREESRSTRQTPSFELVHHMDRDTRRGISVSILLESLCYPGRMQWWRFLSPDALGWTLRQGRDFVLDRIRGVPPRALQARDYVAGHAKQGDPADVLRTLDRFARETRFLMNVGPEKGPLLFELLDRLPRPARVLELGAFCGYSAILIAHHLGPDSRLVSIEKSPDAAEASRDNLAFAGLLDRVEIVEGASSERIPALEGPFQLVFLDHWKDLYLPDLKLLEAHQLLAPGCIVMADNVGPLFGAEPYLAYVRSCGRYDSENRPAKVEYSDLPDAVEISVWKGAPG